MYCVLLYIYIYIVETLQDGVGTPPGATKIVEVFFLLFFFLNNFVQADMLLKENL